MKNDPKRILRYTPAERANHWLSAICFILAALSGLSLFQPYYYTLAQFFGGGVWDRILHPFFGVALCVLFAIMYGRFREHNVLTPSDREWLCRVREIVNSDDSNMPEQGKFNGGQKLVFWLSAILLALLFLSGIVIWRAYFSYLFPIWLIRVSSVVHAASAAIFIGLIIFHIYAALWTRESMSAMVYGWVRRAWAKQHHPAWFREMTGGDK